MTAMDLTRLPVTHAAEIPAEYLDVMGHMNVMWYTHLFDTAVYEVFKLVGLDLDYMKTNDAGGFALESHARYLSEVREGHHVKIRTRVLGRTAKRFHMLNVMSNETKDDIAATFEVVGAHIDMRDRRMSVLPSTIAARLDALIQEHSTLDWESPVCGVMKP